MDSVSICDTSAKWVGYVRPFVVGRCFPICKQEMRWFSNGADTIFDVGTFCSAIFSDEESFGNSGTWIVAVLALIPVFSDIAPAFHVACADEVHAVVAVARRLHKMSIGIRRRFSAVTSW